MWVLTRACPAVELLQLRHPTREKTLRCIQPTQHFGDVICANEELDDVDKFMNSRMGRELMLSRALEPVLGEYDFVVVDTPPALQVRTLNGIAAADDVVVPCMADASSVAGMKAVLEYVAEVSEFVRGAHPRIAGIVVTRYDARNSHAPASTYSGATKRRPFHGAIAAALMCCRGHRA